MVSILGPFSGTGREVKKLRPIANTAMGAGNIFAFFHLFPLTACPERLSVRRPGRTHRLDGLNEGVEVREARAGYGRVFQEPAEEDLALQA